MVRGEWRGKPHETRNSERGTRSAELGMHMDGTTLEAVPWKSAGRVFTCLRVLRLALRILLLACLTAATARAELWLLPSLAERPHPGASNAPVCDPRNYPDGAGFTQRAARVLQTLARDDLGQWRRGYFSGGDPGKYLPGSAMAKLLLNPNDPEPARFMNDDRSPLEQYHFAVVNWSRFYPIFGAQVLTPDTQSRFAKAMSSANYLTPGGTENHKLMWLTSANVLPVFAGAGTNHKSREDTLAAAKEELRRYVKGLYAAGSGEWDSSTYLMFGLNGMINIYDFSPDPEARLLAAAALDYCAAYYALKYTDGVFCGPNQRGFYRQPHESISDQTGYLWWGSHAAGADVARPYRYALAPITSAWCPNRVLTRIARREMPNLPFEQQNGKANYWFGQGIAPRACAVHETLYVDRRFTMGSLWDAHASQHCRFMLAVETPAGAAVFNGGHPRQSDHEGQKTGLGFGDGMGRYVQSAQLGATYVCLADIPADDECDYTFFAFPTNLLSQAMGTWRIFAAGDSSVAVRPLTGEAVMGATPPDKQGHALPILKFPGHRNGFVVVVGAADLTNRLAGVTVDAAEMASNLTVRCRALDGRRLSMRFNPDLSGDCHGSRAARVEIDGKPLDFAAWPIASGPCVAQRPGVLRVSDGVDGYEVDFTGERPVYRGLERK